MQLSSPTRIFLGAIVPLWWTFSFRPLTCAHIAPGRLCCDKLQLPCRILISGTHEYLHKCRKNQRNPVGMARLAQAWEPQCCPRLAADCTCMALYVDHRYGCSVDDHDCDPWLLWYAQPHRARPPYRPLLHFTVRTIKRLVLSYSPPSRLAQRIGNCGSTSGRGGGGYNSTSGYRFPLTRTM